MAKTYQDVLTEARVLVQDADATKYRDTDVTVIAMANRGLQEIARLRPEAFDTLYTDAAIASGGSLNVPEITVGTLGTTFPIDMMFFLPLVYFVAGSMDLKEDEFTADGRVSVLMSQFRTMLTGL